MQLCIVVFPFFLHIKCEYECILEKCSRKLNKTDSFECLSLTTLHRAFVIADEIKVL